MLTDAPHQPWATHAMRGFQTMQAAVDHAAKMGFLQIGLRKIEDGNFEWFYPAYPPDDPVSERCTLLAPSRDDDCNI